MNLGQVSLAVNAQPSAGLRGATCDTLNVVEAWRRPLTFLGGFLAAMKDFSVAQKIY